jgi:hypothetical protein
MDRLLFAARADGGHADVELDTELDAAGCGPVSARRSGKMINIMMAAQPRQAVAALISRPRSERGQCCGYPKRHQGLKMVPQVNHSSRKSNG